ncbi:MAG: gliding motility-associated C-terminal domain-containing protein [Flavobacteriia bacterium]|jgi:gliding motility-associated-like protein
MKLNFKRFLPFLLFVLPFHLSAADWYVDNNSNTGDVYTIGSANGNDGAGGTAMAPFATLAHAISVAANGDNIFVDAGTYDEDAITLNKELNIQGAGYSLTIFDHNFGGTATDWFMYIIADNVTLANMQIIEYDNNGTQLSGHSGQAITIEGALNVLLEDVMLNGNGQSGGNPAVVVMSNSTVTLRGGGSFCNTSGTAYTGGVEAFGTGINLLIEDYILGNNYKDGGFDGGGLRVEGNATTIVTVNNSRISNNIAVNGGGIAIYNGIVSLNNCIIEGNEIGQASDPVMGGGIYVSCGTLNLTDCIIRDNIENAAGTLRGGGISARYNGATGAFSGNRTINITANTCIFNNNSGDNGTDIYAANGFGNACNLTLNDCIFSSGATNIRSDATSPASSINVTYVGVLPTSAGSNITLSASALPIFDLATVTPPDYSGACPNIILCSTPAPTGNAAQSFCIANNPTLASIVVVGTAIQWYDAPVGGNLLPSNTVMVAGVTYYATQTAGLPPCESLSRLAVTISNETNGFGAFATATQINANGTDVIYNTTGGGADCINPDCSVLLNGTNFGSFDANSGDLVLTAAELKSFKTLGFVCSASMSYRVYKSGDAPGAFNNINLPLNCGCNAGTFADGFGPCSANDQKWNDFGLSVDLTNGICEGNYVLEVFYSIVGSDCFSDGSDCSVTKTIDNGGLFFVSNFSINATPAPTGNANQDFCTINNPTVANLVATGSTIQWYDAASGGNLLAPGDALVDGNYFATQTLNGCEGPALAVAVTVGNPAAPVSNGDIFECEQNPIQTLDANDALASVVGVTWFDAAVAGNVVASPTINSISSSTFFAEFNDGSCPSAIRTAVTLTINDSPSDAVSNGDLIECEQNPIQTLDANDALVSNIGVTWFDAATGGNTVINPTINTISSLTVFAEVSNGTCVSINRTPVVLTINDSPDSPTSNGDIIECEQNPIQTLDANNALVSTVGVTWFSAGSGGVIVPSPTLSALGSATYFAELQVGACASLTRTAVTLTINDSPNAPISNGDLAECEQNPIQTLDANTALVSTVGVIWYDAASGGNVIVTPTLNTVSSVTYHAEFFDGTCASIDRTPVVLTINDSPNPPTSNGDLSECPQSPLQTLDANDALVSTLGVTWYDAASGGNVVATPTLNSESTITYFAEFTDGTCTSLTRSQVILTIAPILPPPFSNGDIIECEQNPIQTLDANNALNGSLGVTWYDAASGGNVVASPTLNVFGTVTYHAEFSDGTCTSVVRTPVVLTLNDSPNAPTNNGDITACEQNPIQTLDANNALSSSVGVTWFDAATAGNTVLNPTLNAIGNTTYFAEFNDGTCSSLTRTSVVLTINDSPNPPTSSGDIAECEQNPIQTLDANDALTSSLGVTWFDAASAGNTVLNPTLNIIGNTTYFAEFSDGTCSSLTRTAVVLNINDSPDAPISSGNITECEQNPIQTLDANDALTSSLGVTWFDAASAGNTVLNPTLNIIGNTTYFAEFSDGTCSSLTRTAVVLTINDSPDAPISSGNITECEQNPIQTLDANDALVSSIGITWFDAATAGNIDATPVLNTIGTVTYFAEFSDGTCSSLTRTPVILTINDSPNPPTSTGNITECEENPIQTLNANNALSNSNGVTWFDAATAGNNVANPTLSAVGNTTYFAEFSNGTCSSLTRTAVVLTISAAPPAPTGLANQIFCVENDPTVSDLEATGIGILWYDAASNGNVILPNIPLVNGGSYFATQTVGLCESIDRLAVLVTITDVELNLIASEKPLCGQSNGSLEVLASNGSTPYTYTWTDGTVSTQLTNVSAGTYAVNVVDLNGCVADLTVTLDCIIPDIPEIITPGKNGKNETWVITLGSIYPNMTVSIFNRWGNEVYKASPYLDDWDGKANTGVTIGDEYLPSGTYFYIIDLKNGDKPLSGYIELVR